jgi:putative Mn2+ efflux pump MntP
MTPQGLTLPGLIIRISILIAFIMLATWGVHVIREAMDLQTRPDNEQQVHKAIMTGAMAYVGFLAMPFVPGAEIGIALLAGFGAATAPLIYVCTVAAMMLAFTIGRFLPITALERLLRALRLRRAADLVAARLHCRRTSVSRCYWKASRNAFFL